MTEQKLVHATSVAFQSDGVLILGAAGSGKSTLALQLMALGCKLVADDQTQLTRHDDAIWATAPASIKGLIEARGVGILNAESVDARIVLMIDLDLVETERLPHRHAADCLGLKLPCLRKVDAPSWPSAILQYLRDGRREPQ